MNEKSLRVLICDDAIFMRSMLRKILVGAGYEVVAEAETGDQAVVQYRVHQPDFVTMDIVMPGMDGIEAVRTIVKEHPKARIMMCSAVGQQALVLEAFQAGAREHVMKPFRPDRVLEAVQRVIR